MTLYFIPNKDGIFEVAFSEGINFSKNPKYRGN